MFSFISKFSPKLLLQTGFANIAIEIPKFVGVVDGIASLVAHLIIGYFTIAILYHQYKKRADASK